MTDTTTTAATDEEEEFGKVFTMTVRYEMQITNKLRGWLREMRAETRTRENKDGTTTVVRTARDCDVIEELLSRIEDHELVNIVDCEGEIDFLDEVLD